MGYDPSFIPGHQIPLPTLDSALRPELFNHGQPIEDTRFSIIFNEQRGFAHLTAHNIDGTTIVPAGTIERKSFVFDPPVPRAIQIDNDRGYHDNAWDRGHLVRRRSLHRGNVQAAVKADRESSYWTNIAPQHETLHSHAWGKIEDLMFAIAQDPLRQAAVFQAPVLTPHDVPFQNKPNESPFQLPAGFWKIVVMSARGFSRPTRGSDRSIAEQSKPQGVKLQPVGSWRSRSWTLFKHPLS